jgi:crotonobetainyl-CoA:carnitine CoA-transferase CaiB-like acyl-CoA transferase
VQVGTSAGTIPALLPPGMPASFEARMGAVPALGEHADAILGELGYAPDAIARLRAEAAI